MAVTNFLVSSLPAYVQENRDLIIANFALTGDSRRYFALQTGVKGSMHLNYLNANITLQDGSVCGFSPLDELTLSAATLTVAPIKVQGEICPQTLLGKWGEYLVRLNAREIKRELPFEGYIVEAITNEIKKKIESLIWQGSIGNGDPIDGILTIIDADSSPVPKENVISLSCCRDSCQGEGVPDLLPGLQEAFARIDDDTANKGVDFFLAPMFYRLFIMELTRANLFHYSGPVDEYPETVILPGSNARVIKAEGLANGSYQIVATFRRNFVYGTDMEGDDEVFDIWWSNDNRVFRYEVLWASGVSAYFWDKVYAFEFVCGG